MKYISGCLFGLVLLGLSLQPCSAQEAPQSGGSTAAFSTSQHGRPAAWLNLPRSEKAPASAVPSKTDLNAWTVGVAGGLLEGTFIRYAADLAKVLDDGNNLRVIPLVTFGAVGNVTDLLNLRGVDIAITQADVLDHFRREVKIPDIEKRIQYISPLFLAEVHVYAREEFKTLKDLPAERWRSTRPGVPPTSRDRLFFSGSGSRSSRCSSIMP